MEKALTALPEPETNRDSRVEMTTRCGSAGDDGKGDTEGESETDLEERTKGRNEKASGCRITSNGNSEGGNGRNTGVNIKEDSSGFCKEFPERAIALKRFSDAPRSIILTSPSEVCCAQSSASSD